MFFSGQRMERCRLWRWSRCELAAMTGAASQRPRQREAGGALPWRTARSAGPSLHTARCRHLGGVSGAASAHSPPSEAACEVTLHEDSGLKCPVQDVCTRLPVSYESRLSTREEEKRRLPYPDSIFISCERLMRFVGDKPLIIRVSDCFNFYKDFFPKGSFIVRFKVFEFLSTLISTLNSSNKDILNYQWQKKNYQ